MKRMYTSGKDNATGSDIMSILRDLPNALNDPATTTELKLLTAGAVLTKCYEEIQKLRTEVVRLKGRQRKARD